MCPLVDVRITPRRGAKAVGSAASKAEGQLCAFALGTLSVTFLWVSALAFLPPSVSSAASERKRLSLDRWTYVTIDDNRGKWGDWADPRSLRYLGVDAHDVNHDGYLDVVSGRYFYLNPGGEMTGKWERVDLGFNVDAVLFADVDGDEHADVIAQALPDVYWLEAGDLQGRYWQARKIGAVRPTDHVNSQGYRRADLDKRGKPEILIAGGDGIYAGRMPEKFVSEPWSFIRIANTVSGEGLAAADIDGDGDADVAAGDREQGGKHPEILLWWENPGEWKADWKVHRVGRTEHAIDRVEIADLNGDGRADIVASEERWPGTEPDANLYWFEAPSRPDAEWSRHQVVTQHSMNNLDVGDADQDGDVDIVTAEHKGPDLKVEVWENDGKGTFTRRAVDRGKENHLGARLADLDGDGDLDILGPAWDQHKVLHLWRNDAIMRRLSFKHLSSTTGGLPSPEMGNSQTATLVADIDKDGVDDFVVTDRSKEGAPAAVWYRHTDQGWKRYVVDSEHVRIEAGSATADVDQDGDTDIIFGGDASSNEVWWWENPAPHFDPAVSWKRRNVKKSGFPKHHDQLAGDFDGNGRLELAFWNQGAGQLMLAEIPDDPKTAKEWPYKPIFSYGGDSQPVQVGHGGYPGWRQVNEHEGLARADIDGDGLEDIIGGGYWFKYVGGEFRANPVDPSYTFTRIAAGQLIEGGRPEIVLVVADGVASMRLYEWRRGTWYPRTLVEEVDNGHTLAIADMNGDGHLDIVNAEMRLGGGNPDSKVRVFLGDGRGGLVQHVVAEGLDCHEGKVADLDGDGDLDILVKPYNHGTPRIDVLLNQLRVMPPRRPRGPSAR